MFIYFAYFHACTWFLNEAYSYLAELVSVPYLTQTSETDFSKTPRQKL